MSIRIGAAIGCGAALILSSLAAADSVVDAGRVRIDGHLIRLHGVDAPRSNRARCEAERVAAARARSRLEELLDTANDVSFRKTGMACLMFMSCDGFVTVDGVDVSELLIAEGLANARGGDSSAPRKDWCAE